MIGCEELPMGNPRQYYGRTVIPAVYNGLEVIIDSQLQSHIWPLIMLAFHNIFGYFMDISMIYRIFAVNSLERYMADFNEKIYKGLLEGNDIIIQKFFNGKFKSVLEKIIDRVFKGVSFESARAQLFNDLYVYLTENDAKRLRLYETEDNGDIIVWLAEMETKY